MVVLDVGLMTPKVKERNIIVLECTRSVRLKRTKGVLHTDITGKTFHRVLLSFRLTDGGQEKKETSLTGDL